MNTDAEFVYRFKDMYSIFSENGESLSKLFDLDTKVEILLRKSTRVLIDEIPECHVVEDNFPTSLMGVIKDKDLSNESIEKINFYMDYMNYDYH